MTTNQQEVPTPKVKRYFWTFTGMFLEDDYAPNCQQSPALHVTNDDYLKLERALAQKTAEVEALKQRYAMALGALSKVNVKLKQENDTLRGLLGNSALPCTYCGLPAAEQARCPHGFPGCSRADDQMLSKHFADGYAAECATKENAKLRECLRELLKYNPREKWVGGIQSGQKMPEGEALIKVIDKCEKVLNFNNADGPDFEDGPEFKGWEERSQTAPKRVTYELQR